jgi:hypothetical protein
MDAIVDIAHANDGNALPAVYRARAWAMAAHDDMQARGAFPSVLEGWSTLGRQLYGVEAAITRL